jgi:Uma2 family endonuclease
MASVAAKLLTAEEFYEWSNRPENRDRHCELEHGEIVEISRPGKRYGLVCGNVTWILGSYVRGRNKGYVCSNDTGVIVERDPDTVRGPDVMLFEDAQTLDQVESGYGEVPPLLAVEVWSPNDTAGKVARRVREQLRFGVKLIWLVDPEARNVIVYRPGEEDAVFEENEELTGYDVLPDFKCCVADLFLLPAEWGSPSMENRREELVRLDAKLGRAWAKAEILLGLLAAGGGLLFGHWQLASSKADIWWGLVLGGLGLFVFGGYLALAGSRSHVYRWNNRNTVTLIDEIRRLQQQG